MVMYYRNKAYVRGEANQNRDVYMRWRWPRSAYLDELRRERCRAVSAAVHFAEDRMASEELVAAITAMESSETVLTPEEPGQWAGKQKCVRLSGINGRRLTI